MPGSLTRKVLSPCAYWSQARMINELLSTFNWYLLHPSNDISVTSIYSCFLLLHSTLCRLYLGMIFVSYLVILVSFLKASQQWSHVASCDVFDGCVVGIHLYTIRPYLAMCYASKQISYWYTYDFLLDILFLRVVTMSVCILLCRHISSWFGLPRTLYIWEKLFL